MPTLVALGAGVAVGLPYELAGGELALALAGAAALPAGLGAAWTLATRWERRLGRIVRFARQLEDGTGMPLLGAERDDALGDVENGLGRMARRISGTIAALNVERERLEATLRGMVEGVLVTDTSPGPSCS